MTINLEEDDKLKFVGHAAVTPKSGKGWHGEVVGLPLVLSVLINPVLLGKTIHKLEGEASMRTQSASTALTSGGSSGSLCPKTGPYRCGTHKQVIVTFVRGTKFTNCPAGNHKASWGIVRESEAGASVTS